MSQTPPSSKITFNIGKQLCKIILNVFVIERVRNITRYFSFSVTHLNGKLRFNTRVLTSEIVRFIASDFA